MHLSNKITLGGNKQRRQLHNQTFDLHISMSKLSHIIRLLLQCAHHALTIIQMMYDIFLIVFTA